MDQPYHPDLSRRHRGSPGTVQSASDVSGDSRVPDHRVVLCQYSIDDADGRSRFPGVRPELVACCFHRRGSVAVSAGSGIRELSGAKILQFYGSNETGLLSATTVNDPQPRRLRTGGRIVPEMSVRLFDGDHDVTEAAGVSPHVEVPQPASATWRHRPRPVVHSRRWMRMGDICEVDAEGYLTVTGRTSDFIVRGGKNISAAQVEDAAMTHPAIAVAAAVAMPDPVFGERSASTPNSSSLRRSTCPARRASVDSGCVQGAAARTTHRGRRITAIIGWEDRQRPASRGYSSQDGRQP